MNPNNIWNGSKDHEFTVGGKSDSNYATCPDTRHSVSGYESTLEGVPVSAKSAMQRIIALSVCEAELIAAVLCVQDMLYVRKLLLSMGLKVKLPMILQVDNQATVDLVNNWSSGGRTRHVEVRQFFLRELKAEGILNVVWISGEKNAADIFTKNLSSDLFDRHTETFCGKDGYSTIKVKEGFA